MPWSQLLREGSEERATVVEQLRRGMAEGGVGGVSGPVRSAAEQWGQVPHRWGRDRVNQQPTGGDTLHFEPRAGYPRARSLQAMPGNRLAHPSLVPADREPVDGHGLEAV